jgi:predicted CopG family antitoxin|tara:strand:- start:2243 stop:2425 length:183 start_codon:yes stop_codon:yes gene_type:complete
LDTTKWKSIAVSIDVYGALREMADVNDRSVSKQVAHLVRMASIDTSNSEARIAEAVGKRA